MRTPSEGIFASSVEPDKRPLGPLERADVGTLDTHLGKPIRAFLNNADLSG